MASKKRRLRKFVGRWVENTAPKQSHDIKHITAYGKFDFSTLKTCCLLDSETFKELGTVNDVAPGQFSVYIPSSNPNSTVLGIAHLDSVQTTKHFHTINYDGVPVVLAGQLDDRLGVYMLLHYLPSLGLEFDVLLTTGEETGNSTAGDFVPPDGKTWNWMFQFDRTGEDVVMYDYRNPDLVTLLENAGFETSIGSFSDICYLDHLGIKGFNVGVGYHDYHSPNAWANLLQTEAQANKFAKFYAEHKDTKLVHIPSPIKSTKYRWYRDYRWWGDAYSADDLTYAGASGYAEAWRDHRPPNHEPLFAERDYVWFNQKLLGPFKVAKLSLTTKISGEHAYWIVPTDAEDQAWNGAASILATESDLTALTVAEAEREGLTFVLRNKSKTAQTHTSPPPDKARSAPKFLVGSQVLYRGSVFKVIGRERVNTYGWLYKLIRDDNEEHTVYSFEDSLYDVRIPLPPANTHDCFIDGEEVYTPDGKGVIIGSIFYPKAAAEPHYSVKFTDENTGSSLYNSFPRSELSPVIQ